MIKAHTRGHISIKYVFKKLKYQYKSNTRIASLHFFFSFYKFTNSQQLELQRAEKYITMR